MNLAKVSHSFGGYLKDLSKPYKRQFPGDKKRRVEVRVMQYYGIGIHFYVSVREEENPIWDEKENYWTTCWDDKSEETRGKRFSDRFVDYEDVEIFIKETFEKNFSQKTHLLEFDFETEKKWFYGEGA